MKKISTILVVMLFASVASAQNSCLPKYNLPVKTIELSTGKLAYVEKGKGKTIVFIHGLGGNLLHWLKSVNELSAYYNCIAIDLPGYGWSAKNIDTNKIDRLQFFADAVTAFLKKKKIKNAVLVGHSMGGQTAIIAALQNKSINKLILIAPAGLETFTEKEAQLLIASTPASFFKKQNEEVIRNNFKLNFVVQPNDVEQLIEDRLRMKNCSDFNLYCETVSASVKGMLVHPVKDSIPYLKIPVLIVFGANDMLIPNRYLHAAAKTEDLARQSAAIIPNGKFEIIEKAGHMVQFEKNKEINTLIKNFLQ